MALRAVFFDVGETLVDERGYWKRVAALAGVPTHVLLAALGVTIARGEDHRELWRHLDVERPAVVDDVVYESFELYPDALACLADVRELGLFVGVVGNQTTALERWAREQELPADLIASSASWGVRKPARAFFERIVAEAGAAKPEEVAYVGDRVDNDVQPALQAGLVAVHVRRGPWGRLQSGGGRASLQVESLAALPPALSRLVS
jgi:FMN phosphatase YigB (HAD superfamily)